MAKHRESSYASPLAARPDSPAGGTGRPWWWHWRLLALCSLVLVAYSNSFQGALVFDNDSVIGRDPRIRQATPENIESILTGSYAYVSAATGLYFGLFSKESGAVLPGLLLLYDLTWWERSRWRRRAPAYIAVAIPFGVFFSLRSAIGMHMLIDHAENPLVSAGFRTARLTAVKVVGKFLCLFLWPARLSADYSYNAVPLFGWLVNREDVKALIALAVLLGAALLALMLAVRWRRTR